MSEAVHQEWPVILQEDDCSPDARETFQAEFEKLVGLSLASFLELSNRTDSFDRFTTCWTKDRLELSISADDPFYVLKLKSGSILTDHELDETWDNNACYFALYDEFRLASRAAISKALARLAAKSPSLREEILRVFPGSIPASCYNQNTQQ